MPVDVGPERARCVCSTRGGLAADAASEIELAVPFRLAGAALTVIRALLKSHCIPLQGVWMRVAKATNSTLLAMAAGGDRVVFG